MRWEVGGRTVVVLWGVASRICSQQYVAFFSPMRCINVHMVNPQFLLSWKLFSLQSTVEATVIENQSVSNKRCKDWRKVVNSINLYFFFTGLLLEILKTSFFLFDNLSIWFWWFLSLVCYRFIQNSHFRLSWQRLIVLLWWHKLLVWFGLVL